MKKQSILLLVAVVAGVAIISFAQGTPGEKLASHEVAEMQKQINELQGRVQVLEGSLKALESRTKGLESIVQELKTPHLQPLTLPGGNSSLLNPPAAIPNPPAYDSKPPKIWGEREINGWTFYIVPCGEVSERSAAVPGRSNVR